MRINLDLKFFSDPRFGILAHLLSEEEDTTRMRMLRLWLACYQNLSAILTEQRTAIGANWRGDHHKFCAALAESDLATFVEGGMRISGVEDRINFLMNQMSKGRLGGLKSAAARAKQKPSNTQATVKHMLESGLSPTQAYTPAPAPAPAGEEKTTSSGSSRRRGVVEWRYEEIDLKAVTWFQRQVKLANPLARRIDSANLEQWANEVRLMRERDGLTHERIGEVMAWALQDRFWSVQIQSIAKLREKWDTLTARMAIPQVSGFRPVG